MNIDTLKAAVAILEGISAQPAPAAQGQIGRKVIIRSRDAGVIYGEYAGNDGPTIHVTNARQLWKWRASKGLTLIDVATYGVDPSGCKFSPASATLTVFNACALIEVSFAASVSIEAV
jgi:hypothetical protein